MQLVSIERVHIMFNFYLCIFILSNQVDFFYITITLQKVFINIAEIPSHPNFKPASHCSSTASRL